jgi:cytoskeleton protein RodZ
VNGLHEIGPQLRAAREAREISLEVAEEETKIRKKYLEALEAGTPEVIPGDVYARGFLRSYANWLGLDGNRLLETYKKSQSDPSDSPKVESAPGVARPAAPTAVERPAVAVTRRARHKPGRAGLPLILAGGVLVVAIVGYLLARQLGTKSPPSPAPTPTTQGSLGTGTGPTLAGATGSGANGTGTASGSPGTTAIGTSASTDGAGQVAMSKPNGEAVLFAVPGAGPIDVALQFAANSKVWMRVTVDGKAVFEGNSTANAHWTGKSVTIRLGNADGLQAIVVNGQRFAQPLKGGPFTLTFAPKV